MTRKRLSRKRTSVSKVLLIILLVSSLFFEGCNIQQEKIVSGSSSQYVVIQPNCLEGTPVQKKNCEFFQFSSTIAYRNRIYAVSDQIIASKEIEKRLSRVERVVGKDALLNNDFGYTMKRVVRKKQGFDLKRFRILLYTGYRRQYQGIKDLNYLCNMEYDFWSIMTSQKVQQFYWKLESSGKKKLFFYKIRGINEKKAIIVSYGGQWSLRYDCIGEMKRPYVIINILCKPIVVVPILVLAYLSFMAYIILIESQHR